MSKEKPKEAKNGVQAGQNPVRNEKGHFVKGNPLAKEAGKLGGRPKETNKREYLKVMRDTLTEEMWRDLINAMYRDALHGTEYQQAENRKLLFKYNLPQKIELETTGDFTPLVVAVEGFTGWKK